MASKERKRRDRTEKVLRPVRPNAGITDEYRRKLDRLIDEMQRSVVWHLRAEYRRLEPRILATDESPADALRRTMRDLAARWLRKFDQASEKLAEWFSQSVEQRSTGALKRILKDGGISVEFKMTPAMKDVLDATVNQNVGLIKSIPEKYFTEVESMVQRSVQTGRDMGQLADDLEKRFGITRRRAEFIARDQNEKATSAFNRARWIEAGIDEAQWVHSGGGRDKRPTHVKASRDKVRYKVAEGWYDPAVGEKIQPGYLPNCKCVGRPVIKGFS